MEQRDIHFYEPDNLAKNRMAEDGTYFDCWKYPGKLSDCLVILLI